VPGVQTAAYGSWKSPITSDLIVSATIGLISTWVDGDDAYWSETRPQEAGRCVIMRRGADRQVTEVNPAPFNARTRVHEYGGGAYAVLDGVVYASNYADQRLYRLEPGREPQPLTPATELRYADGVVDRRRGLLYCVREDHRVSGEAVNTLVQLNLQGDEVGGQVIAAGNDFYSSPRLSQDGSRLAWLTWNHPNMPWDGTELWVGELGPGGQILRSKCVTASTSESIFQPEWSPDGSLYFISDRTGWWNLYRWRGGSSAIEPLCPMEAEFGAAQWGLGMSTYALESAGRLLCTYQQGGKTYLARLDLGTGALVEVDTPYTEVLALRVGHGFALFLGGSPVLATAVVRLDLATGHCDVLRQSSAAKVDPGYISTPQQIEFPTENGMTAYGMLYLPRNRDYVAPTGEKPPLLVRTHGGPTDAAETVLNLGIQYWTSRGFVVLDVDYGGSTGYGRAYRERLKGQWGVVDVDDVVNGARYLVRRGIVEGKRLAIQGGSAGGYTTLAALTFRQVFQAGASYYGVSDLEALARDTHKFESRYLDGLVGPYPQRKDLYVQRSPIHSIAGLATPLILFQGLEDQVVPPAQSWSMFEAVRAKGLPAAYLPFPGEQHGFRRAENIKRALDAELYFYSRVFGFALADPVEPVPIANLA
jgi:dipeptidyl aminopeptidase/acylaminoacyl peptidase